MTIRHRSTRRLATLGLVLGVLVTLFAPHAASGAVTSISLDLEASGLDALTQVTSARDGSGRLFLVERRGIIRVFKDGAVQAGSFLDMRTMVEAGGERGLLGLAFHPRFATNGLLFVFFTRPRRRRRHRPLARERRPQRRDAVVVQDAAHDRAQLRGQPQRRRHGVQPAQRAALCGGRRRRRCPAIPRTTPRT